MERLQFQFTCVSEYEAHKTLNDIFFRIRSNNPRARMYESKPRSVTKDANFKCIVCYCTLTGSVSTKSAEVIKWIDVEIVFPIKNIACKEVHHHDGKSGCVSTNGKTNQS